VGPEVGGPGGAGLQGPALPAQARVPGLDGSEEARVPS